MTDAKVTGRHDVFDRIRAACRTVAERAEHVRVCDERIEAYAAALPAGEPPRLDADRHFAGNEAETVAYFVTLDAINFGSGYFPYLAKRTGMSGYYTIAAGLADRFRANGPFSASELAAITPCDCARTFGQDMRTFPIRELMGLFARALSDLGAHVERRFEGRFEGPIESADRSADRLIEILSAQPLFRDEVPYRGLAVPFYKRAQLLTSDLALAFAGKGPGRFRDLARLTVFADNLVPHVLRVDGLLDYSEPLADAIERGALIRAGSDEEIEIRACAVHCVELIREALAESGRIVTSRDLDQTLWHRGQEAAYKGRKRHRTRTVFY